MKLKLLIALLLWASIVVAQEQWHAIGPDDNNQVSYTPCYPTDQAMAIDGNNIPYVIFREGFTVGNFSVLKPVVRRFVNGKWENVGPRPLSDDYAATVSIAIDADNVPYVSYSASMGQTIVKKFNGINWVDVGEALPYTYASKIIIDSNGNPYLVMIYDNGKIQVKKFDSNSWIAVGGNVTANHGEEPSIALTTGNIPYVSYKDTSLWGHEKLTVKKLNGSEWETVGDALFTDDSTAYSEIYLDNNDVPYVAYSISTLAALPTVWVEKFNGSNWESLNFQDSVGSAETQGIKLAFSSNNMPTAVYTEFSDYPHNYIVRSYNGSGWEITGVAQSGMNAGILFDNEDNIYVSYSDFRAGMSKLTQSQWEEVGSHGIAYRVSGNEVGEMTVTKDDNYYFTHMNDSGNKLDVTKWNGNAWEYLPTITDETDEVNGYGSSIWNIKITANYDSVPFVLYSRTQNSVLTSGLTVKKYNGTSWEIVGLPYFAVGNNADIAIGPDGSIYVSCVSITAGHEYAAIKIWKYSGTTWNNVGIINDVNSTDYSIFYAPHIAVGNDNLPYIVYSQMDLEGKAIVKKLDSATGNWTTVGRGAISHDRAISPHIGINSLNQPYICYGDASVEGYSKATVQKFNGTDWEILGTPGFTPTDTNLASVYIDNNDIPYIVYYEGAGDGKVDVYKFDGTSWNFLGMPQISVSGLITFIAPRLAFRSDNVPVVSYSTIGLYAKYFGEEILNTSKPTVTQKTNFVYPNPVNNKLYFSNASAISNVKIFDLRGQLIFETNKVHEYIPANFAEGLYVVKATTDKGTENYKFYKQ